MLRYLQVRNLALIDDLEVELPPNLTVLTGETGAGKSMLVEALGLVLGDRGDSGLVRDGADQATITAIFAPPSDPQFRELLDSQGMDVADELVLKRTIGADGRSRAFVNGGASPLQAVRAIGEWLVDLHGQHEHQSLLRRDFQRQLLDDYAGHGGLLTATASACGRLHSVETELARLEAALGDPELAERLRFQIEELRAQDLAGGDIARLESDHRRVANIERLIEGCTQVLDRLSEGDGNVHAVLQHGAADLHQLARLDDGLEPVAAMLDSAGIQLAEACHALTRHIDGLDSDPGQLRQLEERLAVLHDLARKHRVAVDGLADHRDVLERQLTGIDNSATRRADLRRDLDVACADYRRAAAALHASRAASAARLAAAVTAGMQDLGMGGGCFSIRVESTDVIATHGGDQIEFLVSANAGQPLRPLAKVASGGELSRISLAIQAITAQCKGVSTLVFDEVDVGIGGRVAEIVGRQLRRLAANRQVLCVTHLPQVAALGDHHLRVVKMAAGGRARIAIEPLKDTERADELARMLGGIEITPQTVAHARTLLRQSRN